MRSRRGGCCLGVGDSWGFSPAAVALKCCWTATWPHASIDILNCAAVECKKPLHRRGRAGVCV